MQIDEVKKLIKSSTALLVMDNGEPSFVVLGYDMYKDLVAAKGEKEIRVHPPKDGRDPVYSRSFQERETEILDKLNKEILALKSQIEAEERLSLTPDEAGID